MSANANAVGDQVLSSHENETSPLMTAGRLGRLGQDDTTTTTIVSSGDDDVTGSEDDGDMNDSMSSSFSSSSRSRSGWYLFLLTLGIGGLQVVWSVELSNGSPYLLSLGMSKALLAMVWIAGPLTGTLVQPYVGICSDNCRISWGKRKPFMVVGGAATIVSLLGLAWVREVMGGFLKVFGVDPASTGSNITVIVTATILMYCLDFSINTVQAGIRAFIVDNAPAHQQETANAWASGLTGAGNILGYLFGYLDLPKILPFFGNTQFKVLCAIASIALTSTLLVSCSYIKERNPRLDGPPVSNGLGLVAFFKHVSKSVRNLPPQIAKVCQVQIAAWIGWFPFLYYSTTYIGQLYVNPIFEKNPYLSDDQIDKEWAKATRKGTFALLVNAIVTFLTNIILPLLVVRTYQDARPSPSACGDSGVVMDDPSQSRRKTTRRKRSRMPSGTSEPLLPENNNNQRRNIETNIKQRGTWLSLSKIQIPGLTLRRAWFLSHLVFAVCMFSTFFIYSGKVATAVFGLLGISWALTLWAPFAFISAEVAKIDAEKRSRRYHYRRVVIPTTGNGSSNAADQDQNQSNNAIPTAATGSHDLEEGHSHNRNHNTKSTNHGHENEDEDENENLAQAGIILGLHNVAISLPQVLSTLISSVIFKALQKPRGEPWDDSVGWVLRLGGCAALMAAWLARRLEERL